MKSEQVLSTYIPKVRHIAAGSRSRMRVRSERPGGLDCWYLNYTLDGTVYFKCGETGFTSGKQVLTLVKPEHPLLYRNAPSRRTWSWMFAIFRPHPHWLSMLNWPEICPGYMQIDLTGTAVRKPVEDRFREILDHVHRDDSQRQELLAMNALERLLLEVSLLQPNDTSETADARRLNVERYVEKHLEEPLTVQRIAEACGLSESRLAHWFREETGEPVMQFVETRRMERARNLLTSTDHPIKVVGLMTGYPDPQHFTKRFRQLHRMTPGQFRKGAERLAL